MRVLLIDERQSPFSVHIARAVRYQKWWVQRCTDVRTLSTDTLAYPPDMIIIINDHTEATLRRTLIALQENTRTISKPVVVISEYPLSDEFSDEFSVQIKTTFVTPFSIEEFLEALQQFSS